MRATKHPIAWPEMATSTADHRRATAERNVEAILDAAERLLDARKQASVSAVADEAGLSRVTVYAHFPDRDRLLEAVVGRAVRRWIAAADRADLERGSADQALRRLVELAWEEISHSSLVAAVASHSVV